MIDVPEPMRRISVHYEKITPFDVTGPTRVFTGVTYSTGILVGIEVEQTRFENCTFVNVIFDDIKGCLFEHCRFSVCEWRGSLTNAQFDYCHLTDPSFAKVKIYKVRLINCEMIRAGFDGETHFAQVELSSVRGLETSWRLEAVHVIPGFGHAWQTDLDFQIEVLTLPKMTRLMSWTRLRNYGRLPFFGTSYTGLEGVMYFCAVRG